MLVSYAIGTLLAGAFLGLIPRSLERAPVVDIMIVILIGIFGFFILEKTLIWRHHHGHGGGGVGEHDHIGVGLTSATAVAADRHGIQDVAAPMILVGDAVHNFVDGIVIAASFLVSVELGIATSLAVIAHEIPQEVADFGILLHSGLSRRKAFVYNAISASTTLPGALAAYLFLVTMEAWIPYMMAVSAASFIYIALSDLVPHLGHKRGSLKEGLRQGGLILAGMGTVALFVLR